MSISLTDQWLSLWPSQLPPSAHLGLLTANLKRVIDADDVFLRMVSFTREDLQAGKVDWIAMTPREHIARDARALEELRTTGACVPFEKELVLRDGSRLPIVIGAVLTREDPLEWVCWVLPLHSRQIGPAAA